MKSLMSMLIAMMPSSEISFLFLKRCWLMDMTGIIVTLIFHCLLALIIFHCSNELQDTPDHWTGVSCGRPEANDRWWYYNCLKDFEIGKELLLEKKSETLNKLSIIFS